LVPLSLDKRTSFVVKSGNGQMANIGGKMQTLTRRELTRAKSPEVAGWLERDGLIGVSYDKQYRPAIVAYLIQAAGLPGDAPRSADAPISISKVTPEVLDTLSVARGVRIGQSNMHTSDRPPEAWLVPAEWRERLGL
jgi:hypothetical protein